MAAHSFGGLTVEKIAGRLIDDCQISGTAWTIEGRDGSAAVSARISGVMMSRYDATFRPLIASNVARRSAS